MTLHPHDLAALAEHVEHGEFVLCTSAATLTSWLDALERMQPPPAPAAGEPATAVPMPAAARARLALRAKQAIDEASAIVESLAGAEANPRTKTPTRRVARKPLTPPSELDVARARKIMRERGLAK